jgi:hypothetical protein
VQIASYSKVWAPGHHELDKLLPGPVVVQEKVDGSQFSFGNLKGEFHARSKGQQVGYGGNQEGMFQEAVRTADLIFRTGTLPEGMTLRCEFLQKPKHNTLTYGRVPYGHLAVFDVELEGQRLLAPKDVMAQVAPWKLEVVPLLYEGLLERRELDQKLEEWLARESFLGGTRIEGVVIKNYSQYDSFLKPLMGKYVQESFKEQNRENWKAQSHGSAIDRLISSFNKEAIWEKSIQHKRDEGVLLNAPQDIGMLIGEIKKDFEAEFGEMIRRKIFQEYFSDIERGVMRGFPEYYKKRLLAEQK